MINSVERIDKESYEKLIKVYERKSKRIDKIIKQSDRQQLSLIELNHKIVEQKEELNRLYAYNIDQQNIAKEKLEATVVNELLEEESVKVEVLYQPSDILSGDFYSTYKLLDGSQLVFILDGQGHGISPALTIFSISSTIASLVKIVKSFDEFIERLFPMIQKFLGEIEQLSFIIMNIDLLENELSYVSGGTYPLLILKEEETLRIKSNNLPFMNFSTIPKIDTVNIENWKAMILYTDGLIEDENENIIKYHPGLLLKEKELFAQAKEELSKYSYEDDITAIKISKLI